MNRRIFLQKSFLTMTLAVFFQGKLFAKVSPLDNLDLLCNDLFPLIKKISSNSEWYIKNVVLNHTKIDLDTQKFIRNGLKWLNEEAITRSGNTYSKLVYEQRQTVLKTISQTKWGDSFIYTILKYIMESVLGDPIYGINTNQNGWKWINHETGYPRPQKAFL